METLTNVFSTLCGIAWGPYMLGFIAFTGIYLSIGLKFMPIMKIPYGLKLLFTKSENSEKGEIPAQSALFTAMSATVGTGNKTFDVASVTAGAEVGSFVSTAGLPIGTTFTHAKPTLTREITMKGYVEADSNCWCRTESDSTYNSTTGKYKSLQYGVCESSEADAAANAEENLFYVQTVGVPRRPSRRSFAPRLNTPWAWTAGRTS